MSPGSRPIGKCPPAMITKPKAIITAPRIMSVFPSPGGMGAFYPAPAALCYTPVRHPFLRRFPLNPLNVLIIGAGPAGESASKAVRRLGSQVAAGRGESARVEITLIEKEE